MGEVELGKRIEGLKGWWNDDDDDDNEKSPFSLIPDDGEQ